MKELKIGSGQSGQRLDAALSALGEGLSRTSWQSLINSSRVKVNGRTITKPSETVSEGDEVTADMPKLPAKKPRVAVLYHDDDVVVFNKPAGMLTHAKGDLVEEWTLAEIARADVDDDGTSRPGIVHRLDRGTSGVIIVAKHDKPKTLLQKQFAGRRVGKTYMAIAKGRVKDEEFVIDLPLARDVKDPKRFSVNQNGKPAKTHVKVLKSNADASLLELRPRTGRTHQLRAHLNAIGHPIIGDDFYGDTAGNTKRMYLHALKLKLELPNGRETEFEAPLPEDFKEGLEDYGLA